MKAFPVSCIAGLFAVCLYGNPLLEDPFSEESLEQVQVQWVVIELNEGAPIPLLTTDLSAAHLLKLVEDEKAKVLTSPVIQSIVGQDCEVKVVQEYIYPTEVSVSYVPPSTNRATSCAEPTGSPIPPFPHKTRE